jgi:hypothetical protein
MRVLFLIAIPDDITLTNAPDHRTAVTVEGLSMVEDRQTPGRADERRNNRFGSRLESRTFPYSFFWALHPGKTDF